MRMLASVQKIISIEPIEDADRIELAHVLGWQCVVKKGDFKAGDICIYFEIDSFLPVCEKFEFLRPSSYRHNELVGEGFRIKTQKLRGKFSQGLVMNPSDFPAIPNNVQVGDDVTDLLGIKHWECPEEISDSGTFIGTLPDGVHASDETRVQAHPELINEFAGLEYYISTKMDGSSHTVSIDDSGKFHVCNHSREYKDDGKSVFYEFVKSHDTEAKLRKYMEENNIHSIMIAGEYCGIKIQSNRAKLNGREWQLFDVQENGIRKGLKELQKISSIIGFDTVKIEEIGMNFNEKYSTVDAVLSRADGYYNSGSAKEGIVIRPTEPIYSKTLDTYLSMKAVSNKYLLKTE